jgi:hypothetical protein
MTPSESSVCPECGGKGKISYRTPEGDSYKFGDTVITDMGGISTRPCKCVKDLAPVAGEATWWTSDVIYTETVVVPIGSEDTAREIAAALIAAADACDKADELACATADDHGYQGSPDGEF